MDLFTLMGTIKIDADTALSTIDQVSGQAEKLYSMLDGNGTTGTGTTGTASSTGFWGSFNNIGKTVTKGLTALDVAAGNLLSSAITKGTNAAQSFMQTGFEYNQNMEKWTATFKTYLGGDLEEAEAFLQRLRQFAIDTPLTMQEVVNQATKLLGASFAPEDVIPTMEMLGDLSNGDSTVFSRVAKAYYQAMGKAHLNMQDANQMTEVGVPIWEIIADYFNATARDDKTNWDKDFVANLGDMNKAFPDYPHEMVRPEELHNAIVMATSEGGLYYNAMNNLMDTEYGKAQKMTDNYEQAAGAFVKAFFDVFSSDTIEALNQSLDKLYTWATENPDALKNIAEGFSDLATNGIDLLVTSLTGFIDWYNKNETVFNSILVLLGAIAMTTGHPLAGAAMITVGGYGVWDEAVKVAEANMPNSEYGGVVGVTEQEKALRQLTQDYLNMNSGDYDSEDEYQTARQEQLTAIETAANELIRLVGTSENPEELESLIGMSRDEYLSLIGHDLAQLKANGVTNDDLKFLNSLDTLFKYADAGLSGHVLWDQDLAYTEDPLAGMTIEEIRALGGVMPAGVDEEKDTTDDEYPEIIPLFSPEWWRAVWNGFTGGGDETSDTEDDDGLLSNDFIGPPVPTDDDDMSYDGTSGSLPALIAEMRAVVESNRKVRDDVKAGVVDGLSGATLTGTVTTGEVRLNEGALVGALFPRLNLQLGWQNALDNRG